ncbi:MAG: malto-oligosyltrehalose synthase [Terracidiphilus sp.]
MARINLTSTYRLQLHSGFTFEDASSVAEYLKNLGVSHLYCSPYLQAAPGSKHGYDVVDPERPNEELGGELGLSQFSRRLSELGLGQVLDIVPNHMAVGPDNRYWWDVLENGPSSRFSDWFDIEWHSSEIKLQNKVLIPVLGDQYGRVLSAGRIKLEQNSDTFRVRYLDHAFPLAPQSLSGILRSVAERAHDDMLGFIADSLSRLPAPQMADRSGALARHRDKTVIYELLVRHCEEHRQACEAIGVILEELNRDIDRLDEILNQQNYRLAYWRTADQELGYRRFFDINSLIGIRAEREHVFLATHTRILDWLKNGQLDGVRVDHPDGLRDPQQYFDRLRSHAPTAWIIVEKILQPNERLREQWPVQGTSGYDFMNLCNDLLLNGDGLNRLGEIYGQFTREPLDFQALARDKKLNVEHEALGSDVNRLADLFVQICENNRDRRDYTRAEIRRAIREVGACFPVYRTYVVPQRNEILDEDNEVIDSAVAQARERRQDIDPGLFGFIGDVLALRVRGDLESEFLLRFQQFTSPVMAKGVEDTAFYCFNRMIGLNEVGGNPGSQGTSLAEFHQYCLDIQKSRPLSMSSLSTHDTKRSDDVRARLAVLTEIPGRWRVVLLRWARMNRSFRSGPYPDRNSEYFLYQTLIGAWPITKDRLAPYMEKAVREAKQQTSWTQQNKEFEDALRSFIEGILNSKDFLSDLDAFVNMIKHAGRINSLAQTLVKLTAPGVPDTYQGGELWDLSLVDPDNRRPVDFDLRRQVLGELSAGLSGREIMKRIDVGFPKMWITTRALALRRKHPDWFGPDAAYSPINVEGARSEHLLAFMRSDSVVTLAPRWWLKLGGNWAGTSVTLPPGSWTHCFTGQILPGGRHRVQRLFEEFPVALLAREAD